LLRHDVRNKKQIVETYDGSVEVKDLEMGGARFDIYLKKVEDLQ